MADQVPDIDAVFLALRDRLKIELDTKSCTDFYNSYTKVTVKLVLDDEEISSATVDITEGKNDSPY